MNLLLLCRLQGVYKTKLIQSCARVCCFHKKYFLFWDCMSNLESLCWSFIKEIYICDIRATYWGIELLNHLQYMMRRYLRQTVQVWILVFVLIEHSLAVPHFSETHFHQQFILTVWYSAVVTFILHVFLIYPVKSCISYLSRQIFIVLKMIRDIVYWTGKACTCRLCTIRGGKQANALWSSKNATSGAGFLFCDITIHQVLLF